MGKTKRLGMQKVDAKDISKYESQSGTMYITNKFTTYPVAGNERFLTQVLDDKTVLKVINKSLNRMVKSGKAIQVTAGRGRTFRWDAWVGLRITDRSTLLPWRSNANWVIKSMGGNSPKVKFPSYMA